MCARTLSELVGLNAGYALMQNRLSRSCRKLRKCCVVCCVGKLARNRSQWSWYARAKCTGRKSERPDTCCSGDDYRWISLLGVRESRFERCIVLMQEEGWMRVLWWSFALKIGCFIVGTTTASFLRNWDVRATVNWVWVLCAKSRLLVSGITNFVVWIAGWWLRQKWEGNEGSVLTHIAGAQRSYTLCKSSFRTYDGAECLRKLQHNGCFATFRIFVLHVSCCSFWQTLACPWCSWQYMLVSR